MIRSAKKQASKSGMEFGNSSLGQMDRPEQTNE